MSVLVKQNIEGIKQQQQRVTNKNNILIKK